VLVSFVVCVLYAFTYPYFPPHAPLLQSAPDQGGGRVEGRVEGLVEVAMEAAAPARRKRKRDEAAEESARARVEAVAKEGVVEALSGSESEAQVGRHTGGTRGTYRIACWLSRARSLSVYPLLSENLLSLYVSLSFSCGGRTSLSRLATPRTTQFTSVRTRAISLLTRAPLTRARTHKTNTHYRALSQASPMDGLLMLMMIMLAVWV
jgi:hypothetical protein